MLAQGIDTIVLGCTHYPFVIPLIQEIAGPRVRVIDPAPAVARQVKRVLELHGLRRASESGRARYLTTGDPARLQALLPRLVGEAADVEKVNWGKDL
jgi:glutamate racemase